MFTKFRSFAVAFLLSGMIGFSAFADDLEIYLGTGDQSVTYDPNVIFIMDTSGSMGNTDGTGSSRLQRVQDALRQVLQSATNINAGLMRFSDIGGPVLLPVRPINEPADPLFVIPTTTSEGDAVEIDADMNLTNTVLEMTRGTERVRTGLLFEKVSIPRGAVITSAVLRFTSAAPNAVTSEFKIQAEDTGNADSFSNSDDDISDRTLTSSSVEWIDDNSFPDIDETFVSPDISSVIQEVVDRGDWCGGNDLAVVVEGKSNSFLSSRRVFSTDEGNSRSPQLIVKYDDSTATGCIRQKRVYQINANANNAEERADGTQATGSVLTMLASENNFIGLRFTDVDVPKDANILESYIEFSGSDSFPGLDARMTIKAAAEDNPGDFTTYPDYLLRDKPKTSANVIWNNIDPWFLDGKYQTPSINSIVQEVVTRAGWEFNNSMMFILSNFGTDERGAHSHNGKVSGAARLVISYEANATPGASATVRQSLISSVDQLSARGFTPIVDTLYEAALYYGGENVDYGLRRGDTSVNNNVRRSTRVSNRASYAGADPERPLGCTEDNLGATECIEEFIPAGAKYVSPIEDVECQVNNHIVLLSDGIPIKNVSVSKIEALTGESCTSDGDGTCGRELLEYINRPNNDLIGAPVSTYTIGFAANADAENYLNQLANAGGGQFYTADDSDSLLNVFNSILTAIKDDNTTFVSPGVAVNQQNRLTHLDQLYFAIFKPTERAMWPGNLKRYRLKGGRIVDVNEIGAVDQTTGFFSEGARSFWSPSVDGNDVREGGAASQLVLDRDLFVFDGTSGDIMMESNRLVETNSDITADELNLTAFANKEAIREEVLKWIRGVDVLDEDGDGDTTDLNQMMGDPIHSQPVLVSYSETESAVFVATNQGFIHSVNSDTGVENWAIIPDELIGNLYKFYDNANTLDHIYGLDGDIVVRRHDDKIWLYVGMRRGGNNYYVIDVTSPQNPKFVYKIDGGNGDFANLGQSWSRPVLSKVNIGGTTKDVLVFGGGYDETQDTRLERAPDTKGNSVFIVDADNGSLLWSASNADADTVLEDMKYSIPARIAVVDRDFDGLMDHLYVADTGGQIFRLDVYNGNTASQLVKGDLLATLGGDTAEENRRFYYAPDVSEIALNDERYFAVAIGSGFRAGPLNTEIKDYFFMIKDAGVFMQDENDHFMLPETPYTHADLYDATLQELTSADEGVRDIANAAFANKDGWLIKLSEGGEKVLSSPLIFNYQVFFTTYVPASSSESRCAPPTGNSRAYLVNLFNANSVTDINKNGLQEAEDRFAKLSQTGIAPETKILIENIVEPVVCLGAECASAAEIEEEDGTIRVCGSDFECLAQNIYGRFERVQKETWNTETENQ